MNAGNTEKPVAPSTTATLRLGDPLADPRDALRGAADAYLARARELGPEDSDECARVLAHRFRCICWLEAITDDHEAKLTLDREVVDGVQALVDGVRAGIVTGARPDAIAAEASTQAALLRVGILEGVVPLADLIKRAYQGVYLYLRVPEDLDAATVVACFSGAVDVMHFLLTASREKVEAYADTARHYLSADIWPRVRDALSQLTVRDSFDQYTLAMGVLAYLRAARMAQRMLTREDFVVLAEAIRVVPRNVARRLLIELRDLEVSVYMRCIPVVGTAEQIADLVEGRLRSIWGEMNWPLYSEYELRLFASWAGLLVEAARLGTHDFRGLEPGRAALLNDAAGPLAYRAATCRYGRRVLPAGVSHDGTLRDGLSLVVVPGTEAFLRTRARQNQEGLERASALQLRMEASRASPHLAAESSRVVGDPGGIERWFPFNMEPAEIERICGEPRERLEVKNGALFHREVIRDDATADRLVAHHRRWIAKTAERMDAAGFELVAAAPEVFETALLRQTLSRAPDVAVWVPGAWPQAFRSASVYAYRDGLIIRRIIEVDMRGTGERVLSAQYRLAKAVWDDAKQVDASSWTELGEALEVASDEVAEFVAALDLVLQELGSKRLVIVLRGGDGYASIPWDAMTLGKGGAFLADRYDVVFVHTLGEVGPSIRPRRQGTQQLVADAGAGIMAPGDAVMRSLAGGGSGSWPKSLEGLMNPREQDALGRLKRVRIFSHGRVDPVQPEFGGVVLAERDGQPVMLSTLVIRSLDLAGAECVELWACNGGHHTRTREEHGVGETPDGAATAFLLAGAQKVVASRWQVPALSTALMMELFGLALRRTSDDAKALAAATNTYREAFKLGGPVEVELIDALRSAVRVRGASRPDVPVGGRPPNGMETPMGPSAVLFGRPPDCAVAPGASSGAPPAPAPAPALGGASLPFPPDFTRAVEGALECAIGKWRQKLYAALSLVPPVPMTIQHPHARLVKVVAPLEQRWAEAVEKDDGVIWSLAQELIAPLRNRACWAAWYVVARSLEEV